MRKLEALNTFTEGMVMDLNPITTPNNVLTHCLNGTIITFNGNEYVLQNDMGNGRVETAYLPEGYVPMGTAELGGIIYVVSYNPLIDKCQIGCFPSPERNITTDELGKNVISIKNSDFQNGGKLVTLMIKLDLLDGTQFEKLNPGDRFKVFATRGLSGTNGNYVTDLGNTSHIYGSQPHNVRLHIAAIDDNNKITYLDEGLKWYDSNHYFIEQVDLVPADGNFDIDKYRNLVRSAYDVFKSKVSGKLCIIAELEVIDSYNATWSAESIGSETQLAINFKHSWSSNNWNDTRDINPKWIIHRGTLSKDATVGTITLEEEVNSWEEAPAYKFTKGSQEVYKYELTPAMSFGELEHLTIKGSINLADIGSGKINASEYRYYRNTNSMLLSWGLEAYPEPGHSIDSVEFKFVPVSDALQPFTFIKSGLTSYAGNFLDEIPLDTELNSYKFKGTLVSDHLYFLVMTVKYKSDTATSTDTSKYQYFTRWFYTASVFNKYYLDRNYIDDNGETQICTDFDVLKLNFLELMGGINQELISETVNQEEIIPKLVWEDGKQPANGKPCVEASLGALLYKVNATTNVDLYLKYVDDYNIFIIPEKAITAENTNDTSKNSIEYDGRSITTEEGAADASVEENLISDVFKDDKNQFNVTFSTDWGKKLHFSLIYAGKEYNKICGDKTEKLPVSYNSVLTPLLFDTSTATNYGLTFDSGHFYYGNFFGLSADGEQNVWSKMILVTVTDGGKLTRGATDLIADDDSVKLKGKHAQDSNEVQSWYAPAIKSGFTIIPVMFVRRGGRKDSNDDRLRQVYYENSSEKALNLGWSFGNLGGETGLLSNHPALLHEEVTEVSVAAWNGEGSVVMGVMMLDADGKGFLINNFAPLSSSREIIKGLNMTLGDTVAALLNLLYAVNQNEDPVRDLWVIANISYFDKYTTIWNTAINSSLTMDTSNLYIQDPTDRTKELLVDSAKVKNKALSGITVKPENAATDNNITIVMPDDKNKVIQDLDSVYSFIVKSNAYYTYKNQGNSGSAGKHLALINGEYIPVNSNDISKQTLYTVNKNGEDYQFNRVNSYNTYLYRYNGCSQTNDLLVFNQEGSKDNYVSNLDKLKLNDDRLLVMTNHRVGTSRILRFRTQDSARITNFYTGINFDQKLKLA